MVADQLGLDEGGLLQALYSRPLYTKTTVKYKRNRKGEVTSETTHVVDLCMGDIVVAGVIGGAITMQVFSIRALEKTLEDLPVTLQPGLPGSPGYEARVNYLRKMFGFLGGITRFI